MDQNIYDTPTMVTELQNGNAVQLAITLIKVKYKSFGKKLRLKSIKIRCFLQHLIICMTLN